MFRRMLVSFVGAMIATGIVCVAALERKKEIDETARLRLLLDLSRQENGIFRDQLREYESLEYRRSAYEQGVTAGLIRRKEAGYEDGYHACLAQQEEAKRYDETFERTKDDVLSRIGKK